ncbi:MAG: beta-lactamase family protein [Rhizobiaceae bacterium]|nr:beta-lactamase family protein [Rhizobiaceae bacterium]MCV0408540.1 beta-lactamase family protein [Rhizobiaceae bacterium]
MRILVSILKVVVALIVVAIVGLAAWLWFAPPDLIRVGTGYSAKIVCSNVFIAGRDAEEVLAVDVQAPGHPLLGFISVDVDRDAGTASAALLGLFGKSVAITREGLGCASVPDGDLDSARTISLPGGAVPAGAAGSWPDGEAVDPSDDPAIAAILDDPGLLGPDMRAVVVVKDGRIVAERYGEGFSAATPLLGWSMTKTVTAGIVGTLIRRGMLERDRTGLFEHWSNDERRGISLADMLAMSSGLEFNENYGDVADVTRMLYLEPDMAGFASAKPLTGAIGDTFSYSSGTTVMISRIWQDAVGDRAAALAWPREALFAPLGMSSAVMETDAVGTFVGSSYMYATARDWARYGLFLLNDGRWGGKDILPPGYVEWMREDAPASDGAYGRGHLWKNGADNGLPEDAFWMRGHDGQSTVVIPSQNLVVVRLGLTPSKLGYSPAPLVAALVDVLR